MLKVSIIMPYYNSAKYIFETVSSIINQTLPDWELLIVDDCSTDPNTENTLVRIREMDKRIKNLRTAENVGAGGARNVGIKAASGRYLAFCDSDDWWYPEKLEKQITWMERNGFEFTCTWYEDANEKLEVYYTMKQAPRQDYRHMIGGCNIGTPGVIIDTNRIGKIYMPNLRRAEDWGLWMKILRKVDYIFSYPEALWKYRHVPGSETSDKGKQMKAVIQMYQEVLGFSKTRAYCTAFFYFLPRIVWKKIRKKI